MYPLVSFTLFSYKAIIIKISEESFEKSVRIQGRVVAFEGKRVNKLGNVCQIQKRSIIKVVLTERSGFSGI